ncbi:MAG: NusG domain II-containing protein [Clostridia bacterium]|nr:NusG domain II-containing protein [Clostridia bacterium]
MSLKKIEEIKSNKFFKVWDIIIYAVLAVVIVALFLSVFLTSDNSPLSGINVYYNNEVVFTYAFDDNKYEILSESNISVEEDDNSLTVYFTTDGGDGHNTIYIDTSNKTVKVTESDCSNRKDCVYMSAISDNSGLIVCTPHRLKIMPADYTDDGQTLPVG